MSEPRTENDLILKDDESQSFADLPANILRKHRAHQTEASAFTASSPCSTDM